jgi:hypothetical protein
MRSWRAEHNTNCERQSLRVRKTPFRWFAQVNESAELGFAAFTVQKRDESVEKEQKG